MEQSP